MKALETERPMTQWNDDRLDELNGQVKEGFAKVDQRFERVDQRFERIDQRFERIDQRFIRLEGEMKEGFAQVATREEVRDIKTELSRHNDRIDRLHYLLLAAAVALIGTHIAQGGLG
jgi:hypothetical protein